MSMSVLEHFIMAGGIVAGLAVAIGMVFWAAQRPLYRHPRPDLREGAAERGDGERRPGEGESRAARQP